MEDVIVSEEIQNSAEVGRFQTVRELVFHPRAGVIAAPRKQNHADGKRRVFCDCREQSRRWGGLFDEERGAEALTMALTA